MRLESPVSLVAKGTIGTLCAAVVLGVPGAALGAWEGLKEANVGEVIEAQAIETNVLKDPNITKVKFLDEQKFMKMTGAVATQTSIKHAWIWVSPEIDILGTKFPIILPLASAETVSTYNYRLANAAKINTQPKPEEVDTITVELAFDNEVEQHFQEGVKPMAQRSPSEKSLPHILKYVIRSENLKIVPIATADPLKRAKAFDSKTNTSVPEPLLNGVKGIWDRNNGDPTPQTYTAGAIKAAEELSLAKAADTIVTTCTEEILSKQSTMYEFATKSVKKIAVSNYNSYKTNESEKITEDDVEVVFEDIKDLSSTNPWSAQLRANVPHFQENAASSEFTKEGTIKPEEKIIEKSASCAVDPTALDGEKR